MKLAHGNDHFYPVQIMDSRWPSLNKSDRHIFFLSTGKNSCEDIAHLLRYQKQFVLNRSCLLHVRGVIELKINDKMLYEVCFIERIALLADTFKALCVKTFYDFLQQELSGIQKYVAHSTENRLEGEFFAMLHFLARIAAYPSEQTYLLFQTSVEGYQLYGLSDNEFEILISSLLQTFSHCFLTQWTPEIEKSWSNFCFILKHAIFALCEQK